MTVAIEDEQHPCAGKPAAFTKPLKEQVEESITAVTISDTEERDYEGSSFDPTEADLYFTGFHEYYMRKEQIEYIVPVIFEDGMDFEECQQYYASLKSQEPTARSSLRTRLQRKSSLRELQQIIANDSPSCLRRMPKYKSKIDLEKAKIRRCSFGGTAPVGNERPCLQRSNSHRDVGESSPGVSFHHNVQVWTVYAAYEYPQDIRSQMWMSREEMRHCMQRAVAEKVAERRRALMRQQSLEKKLAEEEAMKQLALAESREGEQEPDYEYEGIVQPEEPEYHVVEPQEDTTPQHHVDIIFIPDDKKDSVQRQNSDNCVMNEFQHTSEHLEVMNEFEHTSERLEI